MKDISNERGVVSVLAVILVVLVVIAVGMAIYNVSSRTKGNKTATPSPVAATSPSPTPGPANCSAGTSGDWRVATSGMAKYAIKYPSGWACKTFTNNGGAEELILTSPNNFEVQLVSFTKNSRYGYNVSNTCGGCISTNSSETISVPGYGPLLLDAVTAEGGGTNSTINELIARAPDQSLLIPSPKAPGMYTTVWSVFQGPSQDEQTRQTPAQFAAMSDVQTAKQVLKTLSYQ